MSHPKERESVQLAIDSNPFEHLQISDTNILNSLEGRSACPNCGKSRKFYCYTCYVPVSELQEKLPYIKLPVKVDIIKHRNEIDGKSTSGHAKILAPDDVRIYTYPDIPNYDSSERVVLIFPSSSSCSIQQLFDNQIPRKTIKDHEGTLLKKLTITDTNNEFLMADALPVDRAVFIDSTWNQSRGIYKDERIKKLQSVFIQNRISQFWRHQKGSPRWYLATIEAIHQFLLEIHANAWGVHSNYQGLKHCFSDLHIMPTSITNSEKSYNGQYDNLLYFFKHMYHLIHEYYDHEQLYAYKRRLM